MSDRDRVPRLRRPIPEKDEYRTRAMPNDRVQLRPPRRLTAASALLCLKPQNPLSGKEFDIGACIIDAISVLSVLNPFLEWTCRRHSVGTISKILPSA